MFWAKRQGMITEKPEFVVGLFQCRCVSGLMQAVDTCTCSRTEPKEPSTTGIILLVTTA